MFEQKMVKPQPDITKIVITDLEQDIVAVLIEILVLLVILSESFDVVCLLESLCYTHFSKQSAKKVSIPSPLSNLIELNHVNI